MVVTVAGLASLDSVSELFVMTESGDILEKYPLEQGQRGSSNLFGAAFMPPNKPFRLGLLAFDQCNPLRPVTRLKNTIITAQLFLTKTNTETTKVVKPGDHSDVVFKLYPSQELSGDDVVDDYQEVVIEAFANDEGLEPIGISVVVEENVDTRKRRSVVSSSGKGQLKTTVSLKKGQIAIVTVTFAVAEDVHLGQTSSATIVVSDGDSFNYVPVEVVFGTKV